MNMPSQRALTWLLVLLPHGARSQLGSFGGDACLPRDIISLIRGDIVKEVATRCVRDDSDEVYGAEPCSAACLKAILELKQQPCFSHLTQSQRLQGRMSGPSLSSMQGTWFGLYPASGIELLELRYNTSLSTLQGTKLTGNQFVRAGRISWEATRSGCRVVSSQWANVYTPRWDACTLSEPPLTCSRAV